MNILYSFTKTIHGVIIMNSNPLKDLPLGLGLALAQNTKALDAFSGMTEQQKKEIIKKTHSIQSKQEMQAFVNSLNK